jgi:S-adenosyl-L-methionine hydrolase (adenosine-forming)
MVRPIVALLTDFGTRDHYAGAMKGVVLSVCPEATLVDIAHDLPAHDRLAAALALAACYRDFPAGTIFLVVVDPGVGTARRALAVEAGDYRFVGPDNGVLTAVWRDTPPRRIVELREPAYARAPVSRTFEGRDRFAPAAGWLARGVDCAAFGDAVNDPVRLDIPEPRTAEAGIDGVVLRVDRFGNLTTNIPREALERWAEGAAVRVEMAGHDVARLVATYAEAPAGEVCALFGSSDHLEIAVSGGSAAARLRLEAGAAVRVRRARDGRAE